MLLEAKKIVKETEKAVAVANGAYAEAKETARYDVKELTGAQVNTLRNGGSLIWLPRSQVVIEDGHVVDMPAWLAAKNGFKTVEGEARKNDPEVQRRTLFAVCKANRVKGATADMTADELNALLKKAGFVGLAG